MIPYSKQFISKKDIKAVINVLKSKYLTQGEQVPIFEKKIKNYVGSKHALAVSSASAALHLSCIALGLKKNDILWTVPNTFVSSASCGLHCGANVSFVDIDVKSNNICIQKLEEKLKIAKKQKKLPKILVPVHFAGRPTPQEKIYKLSKIYGFKILEDASHSLGARYKKNKVGNCKWSDITVFSFHPVKPITTGEGGMITTNTRKYGDILLKLRTHGITKDIKQLKKKIKSKWYYEQQLLGFNYRMSDIQAALGVSQLKNINNFLNYRNKIAKRYLQKLKDLPIILPEIDKNIYSSYHLFVIRFKLDVIKKTYDKIFNEILSKGIGINLHYLPVHLQPIFKKMGFKNGNYPISESYSKSAISIPIYYQMSKLEQDKVIRVLHEVLR